MIPFDPSQIIRAMLFAAFALFTAAVSLAIEPTYDSLLVPELARSQLYPGVLAAGPGQATYLATAAHFSGYLVANLVDPAVALVGVGIGLAYLLHAVWPRPGLVPEGLLARFVIAVLVANFAVPIASGILDLGGTVYPVVAGWDGGAWRHWTNLAGIGEFGLSSSNGLLAFVLSFVEFSVVLLLALLVGLRDALLAVLVVVLPIFTLLWPLGPFSTLARRGWLLFAEFAFLPCVLVIPLELAVGSTSPILLVAFLALALGSPALLSLSGTMLSQLGLPSAGAALTGGVERALAAAPRSSVGGIPSGGPSSAGAAGAAGRGARAAGGAAIPGAAPLAVSAALGSGAQRLVG
ncbi:MAG: hypothetical protein QXG65_04685, partial [Thermoplasmata archaeon]